jgi:endonuclease/exonuclease/phosphatase (EEP) superfamily protein YafD
VTSQHFQDHTWLRARIWGALDALGFITCVATVLGFASRVGWPVELAAHFRVQYFLILASLALISAWARRHVATSVLSVCALANGAVIFPVWIGGPVVAEAERAALRLMLVNVATKNRDHTAVIEAVREASPDVVFFEEVNQRWLTHLSELSGGYPISLAESRDDNFGMAVFSRLPLTDSRVVFIGAAHVPSIVVRLFFEGETVTVVGTHTLPPGSREYAELRDEQLLRLGDFLSALQRPYALLGDLNISPWSDQFYRLLDTGKVLDSTQGIGLMPTWPADFWPLLIPIDHCLISSDIRVVDRRIGPFVGSDHYPLVVDLTLVRKDQRSSPIVVRPTTGEDQVSEHDA